MKRYLGLEGMGDSTSPMILTRRLSVDVSRGGREWSLSPRGKWGWGWVAADREPPETKYVPVGLLRGDRYRVRLISFEPYLTGYFLRFVWKTFAVE